ncbi:hypothetical protein [Acinetobacter sp. UBA6571]|uniref:hypothetical protein n=1 Tax=Acinetobacter sp. UBA6571 TaxID=1945951 RepID=UPI002579D002|nr:hypothetical protein [Acinetobacter sp. UBA6571]
MKYLIIGLLVLASGMFYFMHQSNKASAERLKQAEIAHQQKLEMEKQAEAEAQKKHEMELKAKQAERKKIEQAAELEKAQKIEIEQQEYKLFMSLLAKWMSQDNIAGSTSRIAASAPVTELRKIHDELRSTNITGCLKDAKGKLLDAMNDDLTMYLYFMQNDIRGNLKIPDLKVSYLNKLSNAIELSTGCKNQFGLKSNS